MLSMLPLAGSPLLSSGTHPGVAPRFPRRLEWRLADRFQSSGRLLAGLCAMSTTSAALAVASRRHRGARRQYLRRYATRERVDASGVDVISKPQPVERGPEGPERYEEQLAGKLEWLDTVIGEHIKDVELRVFRSEPVHYLHRAGFNIWQRCGTNKKKRVVRGRADKKVDGLPIRVHQGLNDSMTYSRRLSLRINELLPLVREALLMESARVEDLESFQVLTGSGEQALLAFWYRCSLSRDWKENFADRLEEKLKCSVVGHSRQGGERHCSGDGFIVQNIEVHGRSYPQIRRDGVFCQANLGTCESMLRWTSEVTRPCSGDAPSTDLLELHCGNGSRSYHTGEVTFVAMSTESISDALAGGAAGALPGYNFQTCLVDPPREGLDEPARRVLLRIPRTVYISCSPQSLARDLEWLQEKSGNAFVVKHAAFFDQFPYSHHAEMGLVLERSRPYEPQEEHDEV
eukprot:TRINITY_DN30726_c0_g1_i1.p1 TRINITY_DN30726_c0_g1~~TRINITY_DN30726_c0_g1_i1.p1  ORF type:complete len:460 (-),score=68.46 TRINITY_DN30726_c0_g1_i1:366-1745(-)